MSGETKAFELEFFKSRSMKRKQCTSCLSYFWTSDDKRKTCGDPPCDEYGFIGMPPTATKYNLDEMRKEFLDFFRATHKIVSPYPIVPRWRDDVLLVNASIYDFQPQVTSGLVAPPGNPLAMSQPCIRMNDIDQVGVTGRHLTSFEMLCHDSFNTDNKEIYWKEGTVRYCNEFLTQKLGIDQKLITFKEKPWSGGGNAGNALEVFVLGLEVATLVFMDLSEDEDGEIEIEGKRYSPMPQRIVDTGYGLERLVWLSNGTSTVYDSIFPKILSAILNEAGITRPDENMIARIVRAMASDETELPLAIIRRVITSHATENGNNSDEITKEMEKLMAAFILADHSRSLLFMFSDYVIPSNVKVGYLSRLLIRRSLRYLSEIGSGITLLDLIRMQKDNLGDMKLNFPEEFIRDVIEEETTKYEAALKRGEAVLRRTIEKAGSVGEEQLLELYDSYGIYPEFASQIYKEITGKNLEIPHNFQAKVVSLHDVKKLQREPTERFPDIFTRSLYYDDVNMREFTASVMYSGNGYVILDQTAFYPEGGGQPYDLGVLKYGNYEVEVTRVEKHGKAIVHYINGNIPEKSRVKGIIDYERRWQLMVHHSATHLLLGAMRRVIGDHVWQSGVQKEVADSRIDITNYRKIDADTILKIERECHKIITESRKITVKNIEWNNAIERYGFRLFQGGVPLSDKLRVVEIDGVDAEGCGGTHLSSTAEIGLVKIKSVENIQEGIQRIIFVAGPAAVNLFNNSYKELAEIRKIIGYSEGNISDAIRVIVNENIDARKNHEKHLKESVKALIHTGKTIESGKERVIFIHGSLDEDAEKDLSKAAYGLEANVVIVSLDRHDSKKHMIFVRDQSSARKIAQGLGLPDNGNNGSDRYYSAISSRNLDEKLIRSFFDSKLQ
ncbi:MAG: alanine--tRNA ligase [Thermoplasmataceae archaeon]